jgi:trehalose synthase
MRRMADPWDVVVPARPPAHLARLLGTARSAALQQAVDSARRALGPRRLWNVNSTASGGGVAEMLRLLVGYARGIDVDARWVVIEGDPEFFAVTKRLHNRLHGVSGDEGTLATREADIYRSTSEANATALCSRVDPDDVVILHDPQTAGLAERLAQHGARVVWRSHIGTERPNEYTREAWDFLLPHLAACDSFVFSDAEFVPLDLTEADVWIIEPSIDPLSAKNRPLPRRRVAELLVRIGLIPGEPPSPRTFVLANAGPLSPADRLVLQISRWDRLKDMLGVLNGFSDHVARRSDARLVLAGPSVDGVADDPEGAQVLDECLAAWEALPHATRERIRLVALPMEDVVENALMVNALQRHATIVVQKSLREGFGLTVTEAMWKSRPVLASAVGGIVDQMPPGTGVLLEDPTDLAMFGRTLTSLLADEDELARLGRRARRHVRDHFLTDRHLIDYARLIEHVCAH